MRSHLIALAVFSEAAFGLSLSPMLLDEIVGYSHAIPVFSVTNHQQEPQSYDVTVDHIGGNDGIYSSSIFVAGGAKHSMQIPIVEIPPDQLMVYRVCVKESEGSKVQKSGHAVSLRACARLRVYWPRSILARQ